MLVLSRKLGQKIILQAGAHRIEIVIADVDRGKVKLGISASKEVQIWRSELEPEKDESTELKP